MDHAFGPGGLHRVEINIRPENGPSRRVVEKLGFREEAYHPRYMHIDGSLARPPRIRDDQRGGRRRGWPAGPLAKLRAVPLTAMIFSGVHAPGAAREFPQLPPVTSGRLGLAVSSCTCGAVQRGHAQRLTGGVRVPTSVLLAVLAAAGLLALAPALVRRYDATERLAAERASSTARVLQRRRRLRTVPGRRPVNPGRQYLVTSARP